MSDDTANHRPLDQDPETEPVVWDGKPTEGETVTDVSPF